MPTIGVVLIVIGLMVSREGIAAETQTPDSLQFEVASVKENKTNERNASRLFLPGGRVDIRNMTLRMLIGFAYGIDTVAEEYRLVGGAEDLLVRKFDIAALPPANSASAPHDLMAMLRTLLKDRFGLRVHTEMPPMSVYALTVAEEGKLGPKLRRSEHNCREWGTSKAGLEKEPRDENGVGLCGMRQLEILPGGVRRRSAGTIATLAQLMQRLVPELRDRRVVDMTGLAGNYEWEITYSQSEGGQSSDDNLPSIFTAVREQLGLKLEPKIAPVEVLVIDAVRLPTPD